MVKSDNLFVSYTIFPANFVKQENGFRQVPGLSGLCLAQEGKRLTDFSSGTNAAII